MLTDVKATESPTLKHFTQLKFNAQLHEGYIITLLNILNK